MKFRYWTAAVAAVLAAIVTIDTQEVAALYQKGSSVKLLNNKNFQKVVYQSKVGPNIG
jgi:translation elongation factor P/translation initiation factor 5A